MEQAPKQTNIPKINLETLMDERCQSCYAIINELDFLFIIFFYLFIFFVKYFYETCKKTNNFFKLFWGFEICK